MEDLYLSEIFIYPIKSLGGISVQQAEVEERGLRYDRRWMLVDKEGNFLTQRQHSQMALLQVTLQEDGLSVTHKQGLLEPIFVPCNEHTDKEVAVTIWDDVCTALEVSNEISKWFSDALQMPARLVLMPTTTQRLVDQKYAQQGEIVSFADGYPFLMIGQASLEDLNSRLKEPVPMNRFRPNFVFRGGTAFTEDTFVDFTISAIAFRVAKPCARCVVTTINQNTGEKAAEPLKTLSSYRRVNNKVMFGQNLVHAGAGVVKVGDKLAVQSWK
ncbi:MOSC domain-containing protein [Pontibacter silvestris]|uniref:MOSC domain-containing protein n=1 Tax=Pontibacter silvestris TaxID=2305183 RepID=A0ABW4X524_9BACT|nr:MOSC N-terminal beta barrel domain-containing protein [Pontibacter silvestris]MCC9137056.1 MOSC domain-containing protein [Pontibacter silvestris]